MALEIEQVETIEDFKQEAEQIEKPVEVPQALSLAIRIRRSLHMFAFVLQGLLYTFYGPITSMVTWKSDDCSTVYEPVTGMVTCKSTQSSPFKTHGVFLIICNIAFGTMIICFPVLIFIIVDSEASGSTEYVDSTSFQLLSAITLYAVIVAYASLACVANVPEDRLWIGYTVLVVILFAVVFLGCFEHIYRYVHAKGAARANKNKSDAEKANKVNTTKSDGEKTNETDSEEAAKVKQSDPAEKAKAETVSNEDRGKVAEKV